MLARVSVVTLGMIAGQNALIKEKCNARTSLLDVAKVLTGIIDSRLDAAHFRDSLHTLPPARKAVPATTSLNDVLASFLSPCDRDGSWSRRCRRPCCFA